jgi:hypothetical protein
VFNSRTPVASHFALSALLALVQATIGHHRVRIKLADWPDEIAPETSLVH